MKGSSPAVFFFFVETNCGSKLCVRRVVWYVTSCVVWHATQTGLFSNRRKYWRSDGLGGGQGCRRARERAATRQMCNLGARERALTALEPLGCRRDVDAPGRACCPVRLLVKKYCSFYEVGG